MIFRNFLRNLALTTLIFISCISKNHACDNSTITLVGKALNADGSTSYVLDLFVELGTFDNSYYGFTLSFNSSSGTPQVILGGPQPTTAIITSANLGAGNLSGSLTALTNSNINSIANDNCWTKYENQTNVVSYESNQLFGATSNDFTTSVKIKVMGCVDEIVFDAHPRMSSGISCNSPLCLYTLNLNNTPFIQVSPDTTICNNNSVELYADTAFGGILTEQFTMNFNAPFSHTTTNTTLPGTYYAIISGTFFGSTNETRDACYGNGWFNGFVWAPGMVWKWNGVNPSTQAQIPNSYNPNHEYQLFFTGGSAQTFSFTDNGSYLDNGGFLDFKIYYLGNLTWSNGITTTTNLVNPNISSTYTATIDQGGCINSDDVIVTVSPTNNTIDTQIACGSFTWTDGNTYTSSNNTASQLLTNNNGCDSTVTLNLTINPTSSSTDNQTACDSFTWQDGITYTANNNTATHILTNALGCDSTVTLNLTIINSTTGVDTQTSCDSFTWIDGNTYSSNNSSATHTIPNALGCDSVVTLNLSIINSTVGTDVQTACDSLTWIDGLTYTSNNTTASHVIPNSIGCDSTVTLNLTINNSNSYTDVFTVCDSLTWTNGITYTASNNSAFQLLTNSIGCDSLLSLDLTVNNANTGTDSQIACDSLTWIDGITYLSSNNSATYNLTNSNGCDSIVTLNLTINNSSYEDLFDTICINELPYAWEGQTFTQQGNQIVNYSSSSNCDSILSLNLIVNDTPNVSININDTIICIDSSIALFGIGASTYDWDNNLVIDGIPFIPIESSFYELTGTDTNNCSATSTVYIELIQCYNIPFSIEIPNSFTPNFDGNNDKFLINGTSFEITSIKIFNRWGQVIFTASNNLPWDGRLSSGEQSPEGTYYYSIDLKAFQPSGGFVNESKTGTFSLFR